MNRREMYGRLRACTGHWDMIVVGGGATGVGVAIDAAARGYSVLLLEQHDFGKGTSSRSTKLVHGGVRYLEQGQYFAGDGGAERARPAARGMRRIWFTTVLSWCRTTIGGKRRSTASA